MVFWFLLCQQCELKLEEKTTEKETKSKKKLGLRTFVNVTQSLVFAQK